MAALTITREELADLDAKLADLDRRLDENQRRLLVHAFALARQAIDAEPADVTGFGVPGRTTYDGITVDRGVTVSQSFANWVSGTQSGAAPTHHPFVALTILDR